MFAAHHCRNAIVAQEGPIMRVALLTLLATLLLAPAAASAQSLEEVERREQAVLEAWTQSPLVFRKALFVTGEPGGFGMYEARADAVFSTSETLKVYAEPVGYGWRASSGGLFEISIGADLLLRTPGGEIIGSQEKFMHASLKSHTRNREFFLKIDVHVSGIPAGDYLLGVAVHDEASGKSGSFELPFRIN
jgi:hypothetical protein